MLAGACLYLGTLSLIIAGRAIALVASWNADNRAAEFSSTLKSLRDAGMSASGAETFYKVVITAVAVLAACGAVFALYTARGHRASRIGMTIVIGIAGLATFLGVLGGTFVFAIVGALAVAFTIRLWTGEVGTYFRTLAGHAPPVAKIPQADPFALPPHFPTDSGPAQNAEYSPADVPGPTQVSAPQRTSAQPAVGQTDERLPRSVSIAVWTAFGGSILAASAAALGLLSILLAGDDYESMLRDSPITESMLEQSDLDFDQYYRLALTLLGICLPLALAGLAASIVVLVTKRKGDVFLFVMAVVAIVVSGLLFPIVGIPWTAAAIVCVIQLRTPESRAWFAKT